MTVFENQENVVIVCANRKKYALYFKNFVIESTVFDEKEMAESCHHGSSSRRMSGIVSFRCGFSPCITSPSVHLSDCDLRQFKCVRNGRFREDEK